MRTHPRALLALVAATPIAVVLGAGLPAAGASTTVPTGATTQQMTLVGYQSIDVPSSGPATVTLTNGQELTVPNAIGLELQQTAKIGSTSASASSSSASPDNSVSGNCGTSWIYMNPNSNNSGVIISSGFEVIPSVLGDPISYNWEVNVYNSTYSRTRNPSWSGALTGYSWSVPDNPANDQYLLGAGAYDGYVYSSSAALGTNGACYSGGPSTSTTVS